MSIQDRIAALEPRERRLVGLLAVVFAVMVMLAIPVGVSALLSDETEAHAQLTEAIERLETEGDSIRERQLEHEALLARYETPAPALAGFLSKAASASSRAIRSITRVSQPTNTARSLSRTALPSSPMLRMTKAAAATPFGWRAGRINPHPRQNPARRRTPSARASPP